MKLLAATLVLFLIYYLQKRIYRNNWNKGLSVILKFDKNCIEIGESAVMIETIENNKFLPLPIFHVKFSVDRNFVFDDTKNAVVTDCYHRNDAFSIMSHRRITRNLKFKGTKRGYYEIENANILVKDFFMTSTFARTIKTTSSIYVFPEKIDSPKVSNMIEGVVGEIGSRRSLNVDPFTFRGIREYQRFDSYKAINWKQSAKRNDLMVNLYDYSTDLKVRILLNLDTDNMIRQDKLIEKSISLASTYARRLLNEKIEVSLVTNGTDSMTGEIIKTGYGSELAHGLTIDKYLSRINGSKEYDYFVDILKNEEMNLHEDVFYIVISPYHKDIVLEIVDNMYRRNNGLCMVVPYYDRFGLKQERPYIKGMEVSINES